MEEEFVVAVVGIVAVAVAVVDSASVVVAVEPASVVVAVGSIEEAAVVGAVGSYRQREVDYYCSDHGTAPDAAGAALRASKTRLLAAAETIADTLLLAVGGGSSEPRKRPWRCGAARKATPNRACE